MEGRGTNAEPYGCSHRCPMCGRGWLHDMVIGVRYCSCKLKRVATCFPCLKEVARDFRPVFDRVDAPLEGFWQERPVADPEI